MTPAISVLLASYNNVRDLPRALGSLRAQTISSFEVIAIDDGSTDGSAALLDQAAAADPRFRVFHQTNRGLTHALRRACGEARGTLLARHDADDVSAPTRFERQLAYLATRPGVVACGTWSWICHPVDGVVQAQRLPDRPALLRHYLDAGWNPLVHGSVMMRRESYDRATGGGYRMHPYCEDYDLWLQLSELGDLGIVESEEYLYQLNAAGMSVGTDGQAPLVRLSRRLADERRRWRGERTSYLTELRHLTSAAGAPRDRSERAATAAYAAGIAALRAGRYGRFRLHMREAVREGGPMADKARQRLRLSAVAPALRALYAWRVRGTPLEHVKPIPAAARLPEWVSRHATDLRVRSERPV